VESGHVGVVFKEEGGKQTQIDTLRGAKFHNQKHKPTLSCVKPDPFYEERIATGGCENDLRVWDLNATKNKAVFVARNVSFAAYSFIYIPKILCSY